MGNWILVEKSFICAKTFFFREIDSKRTENCSSWREDLFFGDRLKTRRKNFFDIAENWKIAVEKKFEK